MRCFRNLEGCSFNSVEEKKNTAFVLMPFEERFDDVYLKGIKEGLPTGWECSRSDERWDIPDAMCKICKSVQEATLVIADVTDRNPNVFLELGLSFGLEKKFIFLTQSIKDLPFDVRTFNAIKYDPTNLGDLHRKLREAISQLKPIPRLSTEASAFDKNLAKIEEMLKFEAPQPEQIGPTLEIIIGSRNDERDWLPLSGENKSLLRCAPTFLYKEIKGRHDYYEFVPRENCFLRILKNGSIISKFPCAQWDIEKEMRERTIYIHELVRYIAELFLFACRIMKKKEIKDTQRMNIKLLNAIKHPVRFSDDLWLTHMIYDFVKYSISFEENFNPNDDWGNLLGILVRIYREICEHAAITDIADQTIKANLRAIVDGINELHTTYSGSGVIALDFHKLFESF